MSVSGFFFSIHSNVLYLVLKRNPLHFNVNFLRCRLLLLFLKTFSVSSSSAGIWEHSPDYPIRDYTFVRTPLLARWRPERWSGSSTLMTWTLLSFQTWLATSSICGVRVKRCVVRTQQQEQQAAVWLEAVTSYPTSSCDSCVIVPNLFAKMRSSSQSLFL